MKSKELCVELCGEGYPNISAALKVPKNTVPSIILKWKKFGTTKTFPRDVHPTKLSNRGRRALVRQVPKNPIVTLPELQSSSGERRTFQKYNHLGSTPPIRALWWWPDGSHSSVKGHDSPFGVCQKVPKDSQTMRNKIIFGLMKARLNSLA